jgi:hypothetical protein
MPEWAGEAPNTQKPGSLGRLCPGCAPARRDRGGPNLLGGFGVEEIGAGALVEVRAAPILLFVVAPRRRHLGARKI